MRTCSTAPTPYPPAPRSRTVVCPMLPILLFAKVVTITLPRKARRDEKRVGQNRSPWLASTMMRKAWSSRQRGAGLQRLLCRRPFSRRARPHRLRRRRAQGPFVRLPARSSLMGARLPYLIRRSLNVGGSTGGHACAGGGGDVGRDGGGAVGRGAGATVVELGPDAGTSASLPARSSRIGLRSFMWAWLM
jgi:hypothetical protein